MAFNTENRTILDIYQRSCKYIIPRYQRGYVWKEQHWNELLTDIKFTMHARNDMKWSHFLGTIVLNSHPTKKESEKVAGITDFEIIDGQQRLTTIYLLFISIYRKFKILNTIDADKRAEYIYNTYIVSLSASSERIIMIDNPELDNDIKAIIDSANKKELPSKNNALYDVYTYFVNEFKNYNFDKLDSFLNRLLEVNIVEIISDQEEEIYNIFEVLNARGQKLKQIELLKNHIMKYIQPREDEFIDSAKAKWSRIAENSNKLSNPDNLINHFAKCYINKNAKNADSVYKLIKEEIPIEELSQFLSDLNNFSESYEVINDRESKNIVIEYFNIKRNQQIRSLLTAIHVLYKNGVISETILDQSFINIRNFFFIFNATQQTSNRIDLIISDTAYQIYNAKTEIDYKFKISNFFNKLSIFINEENFNSLFFTNQSFRYSTKDNRLKRNSRLVKYTLINYYNLIQTDSVLDPRQLTIEHLYSDNGYTDNSLICNLTLTTGSINSERLSNKNIFEKIDILKKESSILANHNLNNYIIDSTFNYESRKIDILHSLYNESFFFNKTIFNFTNEDIKEYNENIIIVKGNPELEEILYSSGKFFINKLTSDPNNKDFLKQFLNLKNHSSSQHE